jgi:hypothetical protein
MTLEENKTIVQAVYPNCQCHVRTENIGDWFLIFPEGIEQHTMPSKPIAYSFVSEEHAWFRASREILQSMVTKLENA